MREMNEAGIALLKSFEQLRLLSYDDARPDYVLKPGDRILGTLTVGWGHAGPDVRVGRAVSEAEAERLLDDDTDEAEGAVERLVRAPLNDNQFSALASFAFNAGAGAFANSTLLKRLNGGDHDAVPAELMKWSKTTVNGRKVTSRGLARRRAAEIELWSRPAGNAVPLGLFSEPHATAVPVKEAAPLRKDGKFIGSALTGAGVAAATLKDQLEPLVGYSGTVKTVFLAAAFVAIGFVLWRHYRESRAP